MLCDAVYVGKHFQRPYSWALVDCEPRSGVNFFEGQCQIRLSFLCVLTRARAFVWHSRQLSSFNLLEDFSRLQKRQHKDLQLPTLPGGFPGVRLLIMYIPGGLLKPVLDRFSSTQLKRILLLKHIGIASPSCFQDASLLQ